MDINKMLLQTIADSYRQQGHIKAAESLEKDIRNKEAVTEAEEICKTENYS